MKKGLFLLPLLAGFVLAGCEFTIGGKTFQIGGNKENNTQQNGNGNGTGTGTGTGGNTNTGGNDSTGGNTSGGNTDGGGTITGGDETDANGLNIDFVSSFADYKQAFPFVDASTGVYEVELDGVSFEGLQCFVGSYSGSGYLMMKNKDMGGECAYLSSRSPFAKAITKVEIVTGSNASGKAAYSVVLDNKPITSASGAVTKTGSGAGTTITATADASKGYKYFGIYTTNASVNGQLAKLVVTLA